MPTRGCCREHREMWSGAKGDVVGSIRACGHVAKNMWVCGQEHVGTLVGTCCSEHMGRCFEHLGCCFEHVGCCVGHVGGCPMRNHRVVDIVSNI
jgi:hypothetical protein